MAQLTVKFDNPEHPTEIRISKNKHKLFTVPVEHQSGLNKHEVVKSRGNSKTKDVIGIVGSLRNFCGRAFISTPKCKEPCYGECYVNYSTYAMIVGESFSDKQNRFNVINNGKDNNFAKCYWPENVDLGKRKLKLWRVDSETADGSMSIALGLFQRFAEGNPGRKFVTISSMYTHAPDKELERLAKLKNAVVGVSFSAWHDEQDLLQRYNEYLRYQEAGVNLYPICIHYKDWDNDPVIDMVNKLAKNPLDITYLGYHNMSIHPEPINLNPLGECCTNMVKNGNRTSPKCKGCKLLCGFSMLKRDSGGKQ